MKKNSEPEIRSEVILRWESRVLWTITRAMHLPTVVYRYCNHFSALYPQRVVSISAGHMEQRTVQDRYVDIHAKLPTVSRPAGECDGGTVSRIVVRRPRDSGFRSYSPATRT